MNVLPTALPGCFELRPKILRDDRGSFVKVFHDELFRQHGLATDFREEYYSVSHRGVVRGLHFQTPPKDHAKLVYCAVGSVLDAAVDLRVGSPTYGRHIALELSAELGNVLYLPPGLAHGFCALSEQALMVYKVTSVYAPEHDSGILWDSAGIDWPVAAPVLSPRDRGFVPLAQFVSPFTYQQSEARP